MIANATIKVDWIVKLMEQTNKAPFKSTLTVIDDDVWTSYNDLDREWPIRTFGISE